MFDKKILYLENISVKSWPALWSLFYEICHLIYYKIELFIIFLKYESVCVHRVSAVVIACFSFRKKSFNLLQVIQKKNSFLFFLRYDAFFKIFYVYLVFFPIYLFFTDEVTFWNL